MLIVDAHQDLAWNMLTFGRDYCLSAEQIRRLEEGSVAAQVNDDTVLGWPDYQRGCVGVIIASLFAAPSRFKDGDWDIQCYQTIDQAFNLYLNQLNAYKRLVDEHADKFRLIYSSDDLQEVLSGWEENSDEKINGHGENSEIVERPVGLMISMEGAECIRTPDELEEWWSRGVRWIGLAWAGNRYCGGTNEPGSLTAEGSALLESMAQVGFGMDISHMDEQATLEALNVYPGEIIASHSNAKALLKGIDNNRHLSDRVINGIIERDGVIGVVPFNAFLQVGWRKGDQREKVSLEHVVNQIDYICQIAGDAFHVGLGTDFDGGFGLQSAPQEIDTIADLVKLASLLGEKGYMSSDTHAILAGNWLNRIQKVLPGSV